MDSWHRVGRLAKQILKIFKRALGAKLDNLDVAVEVFVSREMSAMLLFQLVVLFAIDLRPDLVFEEGALIISDCQKLVET